jgi:glycosyltransferase involved in cell wall biosynthesis
MNAVMPLVSVLMTAYNREKYIAEAIESVLASTYKNFELIIVDDGSTDKTVEIIQHYQHSDNRIKLFINPNNLGDYPNRNKAASYATGDFIMFVDSDDKTFDFSFDYCIKEMMDDPDADMGMLCFHPEMCGKVLSPKESIHLHFFNKQFLTVGPGGTILKRSFFEKIGRYPETYGPANDMYFNLLAASAGNIKCLCREFLFYRIHDGQEMNNKFSYLFNNYTYMNDALQNLPLQITLDEKLFLLKKNKRRFVVNLFKYFMKTGNLSNCKIAVNKSKFTFQDAVTGIFHN